MIILCLQHNLTPLEYAVSNKHSEIVHYFIADLGMDITQYDEVILMHVFELLYLVL